MSTHRPLTDTLELRPAHSEDRAALHRLAALDCQPPPGDGPHLMVLAAGTPVAAVALDGRWEAADPLQRSDAALELLRERRAQLSGLATRGPARVVARRLRAGVLAG